MTIAPPQNSHPGYQLFYCMNGKAEYLISNRKCIIETGDYVIVPPFAKHCFQSSFDTTAILLDIQFIVHDPLFNKKMRNLCSVVHKADEFATIMMRGIVTESKRRNGHFHYAIEGLLEAVLLRLVDENEGCAPSTEDSIALGYDKMSFCVKRTICFLDGMVCGNHEFNLDNVALALGYSKRYICQSFYTEVGMTLKQYLMMMRIEKAKELIDHMDVPVKDIALLLNFKSVVYFGRMFKQYTGMTPIQYSKRPDPQKNYLSYSFRDKFFENIR